jgi:hypothetical protein
VVLVTMMLRRRRKSSGISPGMLWLKNKIHRTFYSVCRIEYSFFFCFGLSVTKEPSQIVVETGYIGGLRRINVYIRSIVILEIGWIVEYTSSWATIISSSNTSTPPSSNTSSSTHAYASSSTTSESLLHILINIEQCYAE